MHECFFCLRLSVFANACSWERQVRDDQEKCIKITVDRKLRSAQGSWCKPGHGWGRGATQLARHETEKSQEPIQKDFKIFLTDPFLPWHQFLNLLPTTLLMQEPYPAVFSQLLSPCFWPQPLALGPHWGLPLAVGSCSLLQYTVCFYGHA